ncbi:MAG: prealbumin-like fold domain-containing protein, partial [Acidimicrobiia bacterium]
ETVPAGWTLTGIACTGDSEVTYTGTGGIDTVAFEAGDTTANLDVDPGELISCEFDNTAGDARVTITKDADFESDQAFAFGGGFGPFDLVDDGAGPGDPDADFSVTGASDPSFGDISVTETVPAGWTLAGIACTGDDDDVTYTGAANGTADFEAGDTTANLNVDPGELINCEFDNAAVDSRVTVVKDADFESDQQFAFGGDLGEFNLVDDGAGAGDPDADFSVTDTSTPAYGEISVTETVPAGWTLTNIVCTGDDDVTYTGAANGTDAFEAGDTTANLDVDPGELINCEFDNAVVRGSIIVEKQTNPDGSTQAFEFTASYDNDSFSLVDGGENSSAALDPGTYSVAEVVPAGWTLAEPVTCSDGSPADAIVLGPNETVRCIFNNTQLSTIIIKETAVGLPEVFGFTADPPLVPETFGLSDGQTQTYLDVAAGSYTVTQDELIFAAETIVQPGTILLSVDCDDDNSTGSVPNRTAEITLEPGETVTCEFVNVLQQGQIIVRKEVVEYDEDTPQQFTFDASYDLDGFSLGAGDQNFSGLLPAGTYSVEEIVPDGWDLKSAVCSDGSPVDAIELGAAETVTCTFTNEREAPYNDDDDDDFVPPFEDPSDPSDPVDPPGDIAGNTDTGQQPAVQQPVVSPGVIQPATDPIAPLPLEQLPRTGQGLDRVTLMGALFLVLGGMAIMLGRRYKAQQNKA